MLENKNGKEIKGKIFQNIFYVVALPIIIILFWEIGVRHGSINGALLPAPTRLWEVFSRDLLDGKVWYNLSISFLRVLLGFATGCVLGLVIGFFMGLIAPVNKLLSSITSLFRSIPVIALVPLFILLFGIGENSKRMVIAYASFWPILLNTMGGIQNVDRKLFEVAYSYRISKRKTIFKIIWPSALPSILTGLRLGVSSAWMSVIAAEMFAASRGIGYMIMTSKDTAQIAPMFVYVFVIGVIGLIIDKILIRVQNFYIKKTRGIEG